MEHGMTELAISEKFRLEEKQRARRKIMAAKAEPHVPKWFKERMDDNTGELGWVYSGQYWEQREARKWDKMIDIYSDKGHS